jgi:hypothetical protein
MNMFISRLVVVGLAAAALAVMGCSSSSDGPKVSAEAMGASFRDEFLGRYQEAADDPDATLGNRGCLTGKGDESYDFDCEMGVQGFLGSQEFWGYAVLLTDERCWVARLFQTYGPYTDTIADPGFAETRSRIRRMRRIASALRIFKGCVEAQ